MLVLTRRIGETILIGDQIAVTVLEVKGTQVRIGVTAPRDVSIYRKELYLEIVNANKMAVLNDRHRLFNLLSGIRGETPVEEDVNVGKGVGNNGKMD